LVFGCNNLPRKQHSSLSEREVLINTTGSSSWLSACRRLIIRLKSLHGGEMALDEFLRIWSIVESTVKGTPVSIWEKWAKRKRENNNLCGSYPLGGFVSAKYGSSATSSVVKAVESFRSAGKPLEID